MHMVIQVPAGIEPQKAARLLYEVAAMSPYGDTRCRPEVAIELDEKGVFLSLWGRATSLSSEKRYRSQIGVRIDRELQTIHDDEAAK